MRKFGLILISVSFAAFVAACGGENPTGGAAEDTSGKSASTVAEDTGAMEETTAAMEETTTEQASEAKIGPKEITNMTPADGKKPDPPQPLPENPPKGVKTFPATTNASVKGKITYDQDPPAHGDHAPIWQNCGFYTKSIDNRTAVHSLDHGVVWITYRPDLPQAQVDALRSYGKEDYVIVSPYPGLPAPVIVTSWRKQLKLDSVQDPRLRKFVDDYRISEISPLSGNRCINGVGDPVVSP